MFWRPSPLVAAEPSWSASRSLAIPSIGMEISEPIEKTDPDPAHVRVLADDECLDRLKGDIGSEQKELDSDEPLGSLLGGMGEEAIAVKRQTMIRLATPSTTESRPKPTSAIEEAIIPAVIAMAPSTVIKPSENQDKRRTRRASSS